MELLPIVGRELRVQARRGSTYSTRIATAAVAVLVMLWMIVMGGGSAGMGSHGKELFQTLASIGFVYCFFVGAFLTADCISFEKREETLGLLFLTDLKGRDVVLGKVASSSLNAAYGTLSLLPIMSLAILFGGVTPFQIGQMVLILASTLFWSLAAGVLISSISENERKASFGSFLLILALASGPFGICVFLDFAYGFTPANPCYVVVAGCSPFFVFVTSCWSVLGPPNSFKIPISLCEINAVSFWMMALASANTSRVSKDRPLGRKRQDWLDRWRTFLFGTVSQRQSLRRRLLNPNPCFWLSSRERLKPFYGWVAIIPLPVIGSIVTMKYPSGALETGIMLGGVLYILFKVWIVSEVCQRWVWDRRSGALELLLSTPLSGEEMIRGQGMALRRQFLWPCFGLMLLTLLFWFVSKSHISAEIRKWILISIPIFVADCLALRWVAAWRGLTARGIDRALLASLGTVFGIRWAFGGLMNGFLALWTWLQMRPLPQYFSGVLPWLGLVLVFDLCLGWSARRNVLRFFRDIATDPQNLDPAALMAMNPTPKPGEPAAKGAGHPFSMGFRRVWFRWQAYTVLLFLAGALAYLTYLKRLRHDVEGQLEILRKASAAESLSTGENDPFINRTPGDPIPRGTNKNVADILSAAMDANQKQNGVVPEAFYSQLQNMIFMRQNATPLPGLGISSRAHPLKTDLRTILMGTVSSNKTALDIIYSLPPTALRQGWFPSRAPGTSGQTQFYSLLVACQFLKFDALARMDTGDLTGALRALHCLLDLEYSLDHSGTYGYRLQASQSAFTALQWILSSPHSRMPDEVTDDEKISVKKYSVTAGELEEIEMKLRAESAGDWTGTMLFLASMSQTWYQPSAQSQRIGPGMGSPVEESRIWIRNRIAHFTGENDREYAAFLKAISRIIDVRKIPFPERFYRAKSAIEEVRRIQGLSNQTDFSRPRLAETLRFYVKNELELEARRPAALISVAVEKYRLQHSGRLPGSLAELVPDFLPAVPIDPFDGNPLRYKILESLPPADAATNGYRIYSIGENGKDEQGEESDPWRPLGIGSGDDIGITVFH